MIFKYSSRKKLIGILSILFLMVVIYAIYRHYLRPYAIQYSDSRFLKDLLYTFPNFWGSFMLYLMSKYFLNHTFWKSIWYVFALAVIYESLHIVNFGTSFDIYDILASVIALIFIVIYEKVIKPNVCRRKVLFSKQSCVNDNAGDDIWKE